MSEERKRVFDALIEGLKKLPAIAIAIACATRSVDEANRLFKQYGYTIEADELGGLVLVGLKGLRRSLILKPALYMLRDEAVEYLKSDPIASATTQMGKFKPGSKAWIGVYEVRVSRLIDDGMILEAQCQRSGTRTFVRPWEIRMKSGAIKKSDK